MPSRIVAISGSLRAASSNSALMSAAVLVAPPDMTIDVFDGIADLPHFNPDLDVDPAPPAVTAWRARVGAADGLVISCPEYARGIPGAFKNALDWLVSDPAGFSKPIALWNASPRAVSAQEALKLVLTTMSGRVVEAASLTLPLLGRSWTPDELAADATTGPQLRVSLGKLREAIDLVGN